MDLEREIEKLKSTYNKKFDDIYKKRREITPEINGFWYKVLQSAEFTSSLVKECDKKLLEKCVNVSKQYLHDGFCLKFEFQENDFITNKFLQKRYIYMENPL